LRKEPVIKEIVIELVILNGGEAGVKDPTTPDNFDDVEGMPSLNAVRMVSPTAAALWSFVRSLGELAPSSG
jgi:hypothetical protein